MKKFLFIFIALVISLSGYAQTKEQLEQSRDSIVKILDDSIQYYTFHNTEVLKYNSKDFLIAYNGLDIDFCGGCTPKFKIYNLSKKTIKYIHIQIRYYNRVDDPVRDKISGNYIEKYNIVGPIEYLGNVDVYSWDSKFYNTTADYFVITSMTIQYMDKSSASFTKAQIEKREIEYSYIDNITYGKYDKKIAELEKKKTNIINDYNDKIKNIKQSIINTEKTDSTVINTGKYRAKTNEQTIKEYPQIPRLFWKYLYASLRYPEEAAENNIQGKVFCQILINEEGVLTDVNIVKSSGNQSLDNEAVRVLKSYSKYEYSTKFVPAKNDKGENVECWYFINPIQFKLQGAN